MWNGFCVHIACASETSVREMDTLAYWRQEHEFVGQGLTAGTSVFEAT